MFSLLKHRVAALAAAVLISLLSLAPAVAQGTYPGSYMGNAGQAQGSYGTSSQGMAGNGSAGYGASSGASYGPVSARVGDGDNDADDAGASGSLYRIVFGDTLSRIAVRFHVTVFDLLRANPSIRNPNLIFAGRFLVIPGRGSAAAYAAPSYGGTAGPGSSSYGSSGASMSTSGAYQAPAESPGEYGTPAPTAMPPMTMPTPMPMQTPAPGPTATPAPAPGPTAAPTPAPGGQTVNINLTAQNFAFNMSSITVPAGAHVVVHFANQDAAPHNFAVYTNSSAQQLIFRGQIITGPGATMSYAFDAPAQPGSFFFRCDVHPTLMNGQFIVR